MPSAGVIAHAGAEPGPGLLSQQQQPASHRRRSCGGHRGKVASLRTQQQPCARGRGASQPDASSRRARTARCASSMRSGRSGRAAAREAIAEELRRAEGGRWRWAAGSPPSVWVSLLMVVVVVVDFLVVGGGRSLRLRSFRLLHYEGRRGGRVANVLGEPGDGGEKSDSSSSAPLAAAACAARGGGTTHHHQEAASQAGDRPGDKIRRRKR